MGVEHRAKLELRLRFLEEGNLTKLSGTGKAKSKFEKYHAKSEVHTYKSDFDSSIPSTSGKKRKLIEEIKPEGEEENEDTTAVTQPKKKKKKDKSFTEETEVDAQQEEVAEVSSEKKKKKKKKRDTEE